jgi:hypothetical protein
MEIEDVLPLEEAAKPHERVENGHLWTRNPRVLSLLYSPRLRDGCRAGSKSTLSADMVTARFTPGSGASVSGYHHDCQLACRFPQDASRGR